jgi:hypothetical protein
MNNVTTICCTSLWVAYDYMTIYYVHICIHIDGGGGTFNPLIIAKHSDHYWVCYVPFDHVRDLQSVLNIVLDGEKNLD